MTMASHPQGSGLRFFRRLGNKGSHVTLRPNNRCLLFCNIWFCFHQTIGWYLYLVVPGALVKHFLNGRYANVRFQKWNSRIQRSRFLNSPFLLSQVKPFLLIRANSDLSQKRSGQTDSKSPTRNHKEKRQRAGLTKISGGKNYQQKQRAAIVQHRTRECVCYSAHSRLSLRRFTSSAEIRCTC